MEPPRGPIAAYRELAPCDALSPHVYAFFTFGAGDAGAPAARRVLREVVFGPGDPFCSPMFADGGVSLALSSGRTCDSSGRWRVDAAGPTGRVIGPMTMVGETDVRDRADVVGVYFRPGRAAPFLDMPVTEIADRVAGIDDVWGAAGHALALELGDLVAGARVDGLEAALLAKLASARSTASGIDAAGLAAHVLRCAGRVTVERLASDAGVSRQHLTRAFRERVGLAPKTYCNLARFQSGLVYAGRDDVDWARAAAALGYADQSHMIAEFRRFSSVTPQGLAAQHWFHPFIERARVRHRDMLVFARRNGSRPLEPGRGPRSEPSGLSGRSG